MAFQIHATFGLNYSFSKHLVWASFGPNPTHLELVHYRVEGVRVVIDTVSTMEYHDNQNRQNRFIYLVLLQIQEISAKTTSGRCRRGHLTKDFNTASLTLNVILRSSILQFIHSNTS